MVFGALLPRCGRGLGDTKNSQIEVAFVPILPQYDAGLGATRGSYAATLGRGWEGTGEVVKSILSPITVRGGGGVGGHEGGWVRLGPKRSE